MTQAKVEMLKRGEGQLPPQEVNVGMVDDEEMDVGDGEIEVEEPEEPELDSIT